MYLPYEEYLDLGGTLDELMYNEYSFEAETLIDHYTFGRLKNDSVVCESVKRLVYALVNTAVKKSKTMTLGASSNSNPLDAYISSQSNDGVSTTYNSMSASALYQLCKADTNRLIKYYLDDVTNQKGQRVLFRGLYPNE